MPPFSPAANSVTNTSGSAASAGFEASRAKAARASAETRREEVIGGTPRCGKTVLTGPVSIESGPPSITFVPASGPHEEDRREPQMNTDRRRSDKNRVEQNSASRLICVHL